MTGQTAGKPYVGLVFELCENGSLYKALHWGGKTNLSFGDKVPIRRAFDQYLTSI